jgi:hypothetical protein
LIIFSLAGAGIAFLVYALRKPKKKAEEKNKKEVKEEKEEAV